MSSLFPASELLMLGAFVGGLIWLVMELAFRDSKGLRRMLTDSEGFAREAAQRPDFDRVNLGLVRRTIARALAVLVAIRPERRS